jgi:hypothetical protein
MFKVRLFYSLSFLFFLVGCAQQPQKTTVIETEPSESLLYDLDESTRIIMQLIATQKLPQVLVDQDPDAIDVLLKNFSPVEMAFEAEVLNYEGPVLLYFYEKEEPSIIKGLEKIATFYKDKLKVVIINNEKLFRIAQNSEVDIFPTFMVIENRQEKGRIEDSLNEVELLDFIGQTVNF